MTNKRRRPWFQLHLSTALILMFAAGGLLSMNFRARNVIALNGAFLETDYGWPETCFHRSDWRTALTFEGSLSEHWSKDGVVENAVWAFIVLFFMGVACESYTRWRGIQK